MPLHLLDDTLWFPPVTEALSDGLLAVGGDLSPERLLLAYQSGIFPWFGEDDEMPLWWSPDPRFVLFPDKLKVSKSMRQLLNRRAFKFTYDTAFEQVIANCSQTPRKGQDGTWITEEIQQGYIQLHKMGYTHSAEVWQDARLVGGLYGVLLGKIFFGESMFSHVSNASKYAFICWVDLLKQKGIELIDCQLHTPHLESLGAEMINRATFIDYINRLIGK